MLKKEKVQEVCYSKLYTLKPNTEPRNKSTEIMAIEIWIGILKQTI
jgi:hypothetical protein